MWSTFYDITRCKKNCGGDLEGGEGEQTIDLFVRFSFINFLLITCVIIGFLVGHGF